MSEAIVGGLNTCVAFARGGMSVVSAFNVLYIFILTLFTFTNLNAVNSLRFMNNLDHNMDPSFHSQLVRSLVM